MGFRINGWLANMSEGVRGEIMHLAELQRSRVVRVRISTWNLQAHCSISTSHQLRVYCCKTV